MCSTRGGNPLFQHLAASIFPKDSHHIYDYFCQEIKKYKLGHPQTFHYLNQSTCFALDDVDDAHHYLATRKAMDVVGISQEEQVYL